MKVTGIIAEYNPFHKGHEAMIEECRSGGATHVVAVMSGNFVQRGSVAIMDKRSRAAAALQGGADLVVELPVPWAVATAERFAYGGVSVLNALGCVDLLQFGAECTDRQQFLLVEQALRNPATDARIKEELEGGISYPVARANAIEALLGAEQAAFLNGPNNILGLEYVKALQKLYSKMDFCPVPRSGSEHDALKITGEFASASALRIRLERGDKSAYDYMPDASVALFEQQKRVGRAPVVQDESERAILSRLRMLSAEDIAAAPDISEGLENRIYNAIQSATSLEELYDIIKTKRYTHSRIRRIITALYLGLTADVNQLEVPYIRVLGFNERGRDLLKAGKQTATLPIVTKTAQISALGPEARQVFDYECRATNLYNLATPRILPCGTELSDELIIVS